MSHRIKIIKEWIDLSINSPSQTYKDSFEVDKQAGKIFGIAITSTYEDRMWYRGSQKITINQMEIYPEGYESKMLMQGLNVAVNDRIITFGEEIEPGNRKVDIEYKDSNHTSSSFIPYKVRLYVFSRLSE